jgi:creatinine amidohydrolase
MKALSILLGLFLTAQVAQAQGPSTVLLEEVTWTELRDRIASGTTTILVPIGGTEQNGPHMTLGKHNVRVKVLAEKIAAALGNAFVAPVIAYVPEGSVDSPAGHMHFPGTITVSDAAFEAVLESAGRSFKRAGFREVVFLGDHVSYQKDMQAAAARLNSEWKASATRSPSITR